MKIRPWVFPAAAVMVGIAPLLGQIPALSQTSLFGKTEVTQSNYIAVAAPIGNGARHQLLLIEQINNSRQCWSESGSNPTVIDPLLSTFNFSGICGRSTDANGYSIRTGDVDLGLKYSLAVVRQNGDMVLIGRPQLRTNPSLEIGRVLGETNGFAKINLNPGWRFTRRTFDGKTLGHTYLTNDLSLESLAGQPTLPPVVTPPVVTPPVVTPPVVTPPVVTPPVVTPPVVTPPPVVQFTDISIDLYRTEIQRAVALGFVSGFENATFRPEQELTREQLVSIVVEALQRLPGVAPETIAASLGNPYPDVAGSRWSAAKIAFARDRKIVAGYEDNTFRPSRVVTRAELIAITRRAAEYAKTRRGQDAQLQPTQPVRQFADLTGHWSEPVVTQMSTYCGVASPLNETGNFFAPNTAAKRNYAAAAVLRMYNCVTTVAPTAPAP